MRQTHTGTIRSAAIAALTLALWAAPIARAAGQTPSAPAPAARADIGVYRGLGSWVDIYDDAAWAHPKRVVRAMAARGVRTLYIETSNYRRHHSFVFREKVERYITIAHARGIAVVAWYLPGFDNVGRDLERTMRAINLVTPSGQRFDSFALDIESPEVRSPARRTKRLLALSRRIRDVGTSYPLGAIIPSPRGMQKHPEYWRGFPYAELAAIYDTILPMTYFTWRVSGAEGAHRYTTMNVHIIRRETGDPSIPIHVIGGISEEATTPETRGFVDAVVEARVAGASYYGFVGTRPAQWKELSRVPA